MPAPNTDAFAHGAFLGQKKSKAGSSPDADLAQENESASSDPDRVVDAEALGLRHRRRFGYSAEGAEENDMNISSQGRKPLHVLGHKHSYTSGRTAHFKQGIVGHKRPTTIVD
jgi:hypothetical protein